MIADPFRRPLFLGTRNENRAPAKEAFGTG
jgi:hypothetical protein